MALLADIHTHAWPDGNASRVVFRSFHQQEQEAFAHYKGCCTVGLHPWFLEPGGMNAQWAWFEGTVWQPRVRLIGEIGLDGLRGPSLDFQLRCFDLQLYQADELGKPVVIHCVRAFEALKQSIRRIQPAVPLIIHGFNRKESILTPLLLLGLYVSFGASILKDGHPSIEALRAMPRERLFLETDDSGVPIDMIYRRAAELLDLPLPILTEQIWNNCIKIGIA